MPQPPHLIPVPFAPVARVVNNVIPADAMARSGAKQGKGLIGSQRPVVKKWS
jgi:hypothetical protein